MKNQIPHFESAKILVYGDVMLDRYWYGETSRISPEAPVPVVLVSDRESRPGGSANVALNIAALGGQVHLFGLIGDDIEGKGLQVQLEEKKVDCHLQTIPGHPTVTKLRVLGRNQQLIRMDFEKNFNGVDDAESLQAYEAQLDSVDVVILSDYAKGALQHVEQLIALAKNKGLPILIDPKSKDFSCYAGATILTPNRKEFENVVGVSSTLDEIMAKAKKYLQTIDIEALLITLGKDGMLLVRKGFDSLHIPTHAREVYDVTGAGDTVISALATGLAAGMTMDQAALLANTAAGIAVSKLGAATVSFAELRRAVQRQKGSYLGVLTEAECLLAVSDARAHGEKIVMTNGCFDILHAGHLQYLERAKALGDRLIVAINDDASVSGLKGPTRPYNALQPRMDLMAALRPVDWVISFSEDTPARLIGEILPDVLVKGGDYRPEEIAGGAAVLANGGSIEIMDFLPNYSTTALVEKIKCSEEVKT